MKNQLEIQRAHDLLVGLLLGDAEIGLGEREKHTVAESASVLCWVLDHDHNPAFGRLMAGLEENAKAHGYSLDETPGTPPPGFRKR